MRSRAVLLGAGLAGAAVLAGCGGHPSVFSPAGPPARGIAILGTWVIAALSIVAALMIALIVAAAVRRRGTLDEHETADVGGGQPWLYIGGFLIPVLMLSVFFVGTLVGVDRFPLHDGEHYRPDIIVIGRQWWWEVKYVSDVPDGRITTANEIHVPTKFPIEIQLESRDVIHSFWVPSLHGKVDLVPGHPNRIRVLVDEPGRYEGMCAEFCGAEHQRMRFAIVAEPMDEYQSWLAHEASPATAPAGDEAKRGAALFEAKACGLCHTIRGTESKGLVGADLTHFGERAGLAAYSYPSSRGWLEAWITHAQSLKPGAQMPDLGAMQGDELQALATYLQGLR